MSSSSSSSSSSRSIVRAAAGVAAVAAVGGVAYAAYKQLCARSSCCAAKKAAGAAAAAASAPSSTSEMDSFPIIDLTDFFRPGGPSDPVKAQEDCQTIARLLHEYGILIIKDPRVQDSDNETFLNLLERYYEQSEEKRNVDARPEFYYQVGVTPSGVEKAINHCDKIKAYPESERPLTACPPEFDPKSRFFWRMAEIPPKTEFPTMNMPAVIPAAFVDEWPKVMNTWGKFMIDAVHTVAEMAAIGYQLPKDTFTNLMKYGPHLLAPTASDLKNNGALGTVFASYHYDLNFLTIHGRSRFPGLFIWTRSGKKVMVKVPPKCLLLQAGKQFEWLTGGHVLAGFHEVVVVKETLAAVEKAKAEGRSLWRISSTLFGHIASDNVLQPLAQFANPQANAKYPATKAGKYVEEELKNIKLANLAGMV